MKKDVNYKQILILILSAAVALIVITSMVKLLKWIRYPGEQKSRTILFAKEERPNIIKYLEGKEYNDDYSGYEELTVIAPSEASGRNYYNFNFGYTVKENGIVEMFGFYAGESDPMKNIFQGKTFTKYEKGSYDFSGHPNYGEMSSSGYVWYGDGEAVYLEKIYEGCWYYFTALKE